MNHNSVCRVAPGFAKGLFNMIPLITPYYISVSYIKSLRTYAVEFVKCPGKGIPKGGMD